MSESVSSLAPFFQTLARLTLETCAECHVAFALPQSLALHAAEHRQAIHCPRGHAFVPGDPNEKPEALAAQNLALAVQVAQLKLQLDAMRDELSLYTPKAGEETTPGKDEIKRRCRILSQRAELLDYGKRLCRFCGLGSRDLRRHLYNAHEKEVAEMLARAFA